MDSLAVRLSAAARTASVRAVRLAGVSAARVFWWWFAYDAYARDVFVEGAYIADSSGLAAIVVAVAILVWRAREAKKITTYGSTRWAETGEVRRAVSA